MCLHQSSAKRADRTEEAGEVSEEEEEEESVKGDERGRRMKSRGRRCVMEVQSFRG